MKTKLFLIVLFLNLNFIFGQSYNINIIVKTIDYSVNRDKETVDIELEYILTNINDKNVYFYDLKRKNDCHYEEDFYTNSLSVKNIYVFKPITKNSWYGSWGYNPVYPQFIKLTPGQSYTGKIKLAFIIEKDINPYEIEYEFNFVFAKCDITPFIKNFNPNEITEKYLYNEIIRFDLK